MTPAKIPPFRIVIVGCGTVVRTFHAPLLRGPIEASQIKVAACLDTDLDAARDLADHLGADTFGRPGDVDIDASIDGALIATPPEAHTESSAPFLLAGKRVLLEKPMCSRLSEAQLLIKQARTGGSSLKVDHQWRFFPSVLEAKNLIAAEVFGPVRSVMASLGFRWDWETRSDYVVSSPYGGVILDSGAHVLDTVLFILGMDSPERPVVSRVVRVDRDSAREPSQEVRAQLVLSEEGSRDIQVAVSLSRLQPLPNVIKVKMDKGLLLVPTRYAAGCTVWTRNLGFAVQTQQLEMPAFAATSRLDGHRRAHVEWMTDSTRTSILDAPRFLRLSRLLELMWDPDAQS